MRDEKAQDDKFMRRALVLATRGRGSVEPNPMVGCVLVKRARIIAEGWHRQFGGPHAERDALRRCRQSPAGCTAYVTLEPCCHHGKTPPCTDALIEAGVGRVVAAVVDPFAAVRGRGIDLLRRSGIRVDVGLCRSEAEAMNAPYFKLRRTGRPWVTLKWAQSIDGRIAAHTGDSKWITGELARREAHRLRGRVDGIAVGIETVLSDNPDLTCRHVRPRRIATRIVLDSRLRTPRRCRLVQTARQVPVLIVTDTATIRRRKGDVAWLQAAGCEVIGLPSTSGRIRLDSLLDELGRREMTRLMVEGGGQVLGTFFDQQLADEATVFIAPKLIGGRAAPGPLNGIGLTAVARCAPLAHLRRRRLGDDEMICFRFGKS